MPYPKNSMPGLFLDNDPEAVGVVFRWVSATLTTPRFWSLRQGWPDLMQETLARTVESLRSERFDPSRDMRVYVQGIARIVCLEAMKEQTSSSKHEGHGRTPDAGAVNPSAWILDRQLTRRVLALASEECREMFRLRYLEGMDYQEIAANIGIPVGTVSSRLYRCLESAFRALSPSTRRSRAPESSGL